MDESSNHLGGTQFGRDPLFDASQYAVGRDPLFDASQYAFFGNDVVEEVELGGLEDAEEDILPPVGFDDEEYQLGREEGEELGSLSDIDGLCGTFSQLNKVVSGSVRPGSLGDREFRDGSSAIEWAAQEADLHNWVEPNNLYRTSSYPEQPQQPPLHHQYSTEPMFIPKSSFTSFPPPGAPGHARASPNNHSRHPNIAMHPNFSQGTPPGLLLNQFPTQSSSYAGDRSSFPNNMMPPQQQFPRQNGFLPPHQQPRHLLQSPHGRSLPGLQSPPQQLFNHHMSPPSQVMNNFEMLGLGDLSDQRTKLMLRGGSGAPRYSQPWRNGGAWPRFKSKYMSANEIENILRMQLAATHTNDPYVDDFYHQACLAKKSVGAKLKHHFCPNNLRDGSARTRSDAEPHPFLQVDALGRVSFSSIRRPRPLLEVDPPISSPATGSNDKKITEKPLEQEPMLAARVTIEDGFNLLLDVDDIDRFLQFNQLPGIGDQLNQKRQVLLEGLASSLQLVDPLGKNSHGHSLNMVAKDDLVFLRIVTLPKGQKLLAQYLQLLSPGSELSRVVCMAIFRHLRFLLGGPVTSTNLVQTLSICISKMELKSVAACLASAVCAPEHPPLRPIGSPAGDGASLVLKSLLERATELLRDPHATDTCTMPSRAFWQASFDAFFGLLTKYCFNKYDTVMQSLLTLAPPGVSIGGSDAAKAIGKEMPVELLRASLPHTSEQQRKILLDFAQRSMQS